MITVISPAKKLSDQYSAYDIDYTLPSHLKQSSKLIDLLKNFDPDHLQDLMGISEKLSLLNWERFQNWQCPFNTSNSRQAVYFFKGDTYTGLDIETLNKKNIHFAQDHTRILSGLYGLLRPLDLMMPYRLEMGTKLNNKFGNNLYDFWGEKITKSLLNELKDHKTKFIVNCASLEYFKSIHNNALNVPVITPVFKEIRNGKPRIISFFAKKARGMMARFIIQNQINDIDDIVKFNLDGYSFNKDLSQNLEPVFTRAQA